MKYSKKRQRYEASNFFFNPETMDARSYNWWKFVAKIDGFVVFNNYAYSNTTARHQWKTRRLLEQLNIKIDFDLPCPEGLQKFQSLEEIILNAEEHLCYKFLSEKVRAQDRYEKQKEKRKEQEQQRKMNEAKDLLGINSITF